MKLYHGVTTFDFAFPFLFFAFFKVKSGALGFNSFVKSFFDYLEMSELYVNV